MKTTSHRFTTKDLMAIFGVSHMTIYQWRRGTVRKPVLPAIEKSVGARQTVEFTEKALREWAKKSEVPFVIDPADYIKTKTSSKPGPKSRAPKPTH